MFQSAVSAVGVRLRRLFQSLVLTRSLRWTCLTGAEKKPVLAER